MCTCAQGPPLTQLLPLRCRSSPDPKPAGCTLPLPLLLTLVRAPLVCTQGYARKGAALHGMDRWSEAIKVYDAGLKMEPANQPLQVLRSDALKRRAAAGGEWKTIGANKKSADFLKLPLHICAGPNKGICVFDQQAGVVHVMNADASYVRCSINEDQVVNRAGLFGQAGGIACDGDHVYVTDGMRCRVIKCDGASTGWPPCTMYHVPCTKCTALLPSPPCVRRIVTRATLELGAWMDSSDQQRLRAAKGCRLGLPFRLPSGHFTSKP